MQSSGPSGGRLGPPGVCLGAIGIKDTHANPGTSGKFPLRSGAFVATFPAMTVFVYVNTSKQVGDPEHVKVFATIEAAETWFDENDPEGVAFEYEVLE